MNIRERDAPHNVGLSSWGISDRYNQTRITWDLDDSVSCWWLRSPGSSRTYAARVDDRGALHLHGLAFTVSSGIRPALWLYLGDGV